MRNVRTAERIVEASDISSEDLLIEFGAGSGMLTAPLARKAAKVLAVELDPRWAQNLRTSSEGNVDVIQADALCVELPSAPFKVVSNLPFGITTALLARLLEDPASNPTSACLLVQKQAALKHARISPTTLKTLSWSPFYEFSSEMTIPASEFYPRPSVDGRLLRIRKRDKALLPVSHRRAFIEFTRYAFTLGTPKGVGKPLRQVFTERQLKRITREIGFDEESKPSDLNVFQWVRIFQLAYELGRLRSSGGPRLPGLR